MNSQSSYWRENDSVSNNNASQITTSKSKSFENPYSTQYTIHGAYPLHMKDSIDQGDDNSTVFSEKDWTPQDSSYGGAFPFCGCIPKRIRRRIEKFIYFSTGLFVIYALVMISMILFGSGNHRSSRTNSSLNLYDDDHYIAFNDDAEAKAYNTFYKDDDDFYSMADDKY
jgi:hypothetical protein